MFEEYGIAYTSVTGETKIIPQRDLEDAQKWLGPYTEDFGHRGEVYIVSRRWERVED